MKTGGWLAFKAIMFIPDSHIFKSYRSIAKRKVVHEFDDDEQREALAELAARAWNYFVLVGLVGVFGAGVALPHGYVIE